MRKLFEEPLVHFLLLGSVLFLAYGWVNRGDRRDSSGAPAEIRITEGDVNWLAQTWARQWQREPTREELSGLVTDLVREQLLAHEARELGLDENDTIIRRRLAQKVEFLVRDTSRLVEPEDGELLRFYEAHAERYQTGGGVSFTQVYFSPETREDAGADASAALAVLRSREQAAEEFGDRALMGTEFVEVDLRTVSSVFGPEFAAELLKVEPGAWAGPIESAYGIHLVQVSALQRPALAGFAEVKPRVRDDWHAERQREANQAYFEALLKKYEVVMDESVRAAVGSMEGKDGTKI